MGKVQNIDVNTFLTMLILDITLKIEGIKKHKLFPLIPFAVDIFRR